MCLELTEVILPVPFQRLTECLPQRADNVIFVGQMNEPSDLFLLGRNVYFSEFVVSGITQRR